MSDTDAIEKAAELMFNQHHGEDIIKHRPWRSVDQREHVYWRSKARIGVRVGKSLQSEARIAELEAALARARADGAAKDVALEFYQNNWTVVLPPSEAPSWPTATSVRHLDNATYHANEELLADHGERARQALTDHPGAGMLAVVTPW